MNVLCVQSLLVWPWKRLLTNITDTSFPNFFVNGFYMVLLLALGRIYPITKMALQLLYISVFPCMGLQFLVVCCAIWTIDECTVELANTLMDVFDVPLSLALCCKCLFTNITLVNFYSAMFRCMCFQISNKTFVYIFDVSVFLARSCKRLFAYRTLALVLVLFTAVGHSVLFEAFSVICHIGTIHEFTSKSNNSFVLDSNVSSQFIF